MLSGTGTVYSLSWTFHLFFRSRFCHASDASLIRFFPLLNISLFVDTRFCHQCDDISFFTHTHTHTKIWIHTFCKCIWLFHIQFCINAHAHIKPQKPVVLAVSLCTLRQVVKYWVLSGRIINWLIYKEYLLKEDMDGWELYEGKPCTCIMKQKSLSILEFHSQILKVSALSLVTLPLHVFNWDF